MKVKHVLWIFIFVIALTASAEGKRTSRRNSKRCPPFPHTHLAHGRIRASGHNRLSFWCEEGYFLASPSHVRCVDGNWTSEAEPICLRYEGRCREPDPVENADILGDDRETGALIRYFCRPGYVALDAVERSCQRNGYWSGVRPQCIDENEELEQLTNRLKSQFVTSIANYTSDSIDAGRSLDSESIRLGLELIIMIDRSSSIDPHDFKIGIDFVKYLVKEFGVNNKQNGTGTRVAVITFGSEVETLFNLNNETIQSYRDAEKALDTLQANGGGTAMEKAFIQIFTILPPLRPGAKKAIFLLTDGVPASGTEQTTFGFAEMLIDAENYEIFVMGVGRGINKRTLSKLASKPYLSHVFVLDSYAKLDQIVKAIKDEKEPVKPIGPATCGYIAEGQLNHWPWLATVYIDIPDHNNRTQLNFCPGTLICSQYVLTSASCFYRVVRDSENETEVYFKKATFVTLGDNNLVEDEDNRVNFYAHKVSIHPDFNPEDDLLHNLALIRINVPAEMGKFRPACLPIKDEIFMPHKHLETVASMAGWGRSPPQDKEDNSRVNVGQISFRPANSTTKIVEENVCWKYIGRTNADHAFCAGGQGAESCIGNVGSPLMSADKQTGLYHVLGVLSKKTYCTEGINQYVALVKYWDWINRETFNCQSQHEML